MPSRILREGINTSERVNDLSDAGEVFYRRGMSVVDDYGRYFAKPELLIAALFPLRVCQVQPPEVEGWLAECVAARLIRTYEVDGKRYLEYLDFRQQVRSKSRFPSPPDEETPSIRDTSAPQSPAVAQQMPSKGEAGVHLVVDVDVVEVANASSTRVPAANGHDSLELFEQAWKLYPQREGRNAKAEAWKAWTARLRAGVAPADLVAGVQRYRAFQEAKRKIGTEFVMQASRFFGASEPFRDRWETERDKRYSDQFEGLT